MSNQKFRYERKFVISGHYRSEIIRYIKLHPAAFSEIYFERMINNIYLDTHSFTHFQDNNIGNSTRKKARVRWYGETFQHVEKPVLEFKIKEGLVGTKRSYKLKPFDINKDFTIKNLHTSFRSSNLKQSVLLEILSLNVSLLNSYTRIYFLSNDKKFRITIDNKLTYRDIYQQNNTFIHKHTDNDNIIVELKYSSKIDDIANEISSLFPFRLTKSSKYVNGIIKYYPNLAL